MKQEIWLGDCLELMNNIDAKSIDMILCDLPYKVSARHKWDVIIPFDKLWKSYERIIKNNGVIVLTATEPFRSRLICSNFKMFKYDLIWEKNKTVGFLNAKKQPLRNHESILVFYKKQPTYNPQKTDGHFPLHSFTHKNDADTFLYGKTKRIVNGGGSTDRYPKSVLRFDVVNNTKERLHPSQKPIELMEYLIKTFTNENDMILDNCAGSGTTLLAAKNLNRQFIGIEKEKEFYDVCLERLSENTFCLK